MKKKIFTGKVVEANFPNKNKVEAEEKILNIKGGIVGQTVEVKQSRGKKSKTLKSTREV